jgi:hypothetical protein
MLVQINEIKEVKKKAHYLIRFQISQTWNSQKIDKNYIYVYNHSTIEIMWNLKQGISLTFEAQLN